MLFTLLTLLILLISLNAYIYSFISNCYQIIVFVHFIYSLDHVYFLSSFILLRDSGVEFNFFQRFIKDRIVYLMIIQNFK